MSQEVTTIKLPYNYCTACQHEDFTVKVYKRRKIKTAIKRTHSKFCNEIVHHP